MRYFVIPARKGSKRLPLKNRTLLKFTLDIIPKENYKNIIVTTDDEVIIEKVKEMSIKVIRRDKEFSSDTASIKSVLSDVINKCHFKEDDDIIDLYLTYPNRTFEKIEEIYKFYKEHNAKTLLCAFKVKTNPYLCFYRLENHRGKPIIKHNLYRYQDYPECFRSSHYVCIFKVGYIEKLGPNMYNEETIFYDIEDQIDVDTEDDLNKFLKRYEQKSK